MIGGYPSRCSCRQFAAAALHAHRRVPAGGDRPRCIEPALVLAVLATISGSINRFLLDLGIIPEPILWLGVMPTSPIWAIIISIVWKVIGFGMLLFVAAIQASRPRSTKPRWSTAPATGSACWRITLPLTLRTILLVTLVSVIGSLLAFDQFYIMTAGQPFNLTATSVFFIYLNSFPYLKLGYGAALSLILAVIILLCTLVQMLLSRRSHA